MRGTKMRGTGKNKKIGIYRSKQGTLFGVLKGISEYFGIKVIWLRVGALAGLLFTGFFPFMFLYFILALIMKREPAAAFQKYHHQKRYQSKFYRSRDGLLMGLVKGIAVRFDLSIFWLRFFTLVATFFTGFIPGLIIYFLISFLVPKEPIIPINSMAEEEFYESYTHSREGAIHRVKRRFDKLDARIRRMESSVTDREFDWGHKLKSNQ
jgi:phage shock protein C